MDQQDKIISGWKIVPLTELCEIIVSNVDKKISGYEIPVFLCNYMDVYSNNYLDKTTQFSEGSVTKEELLKFSLAKDDVVITKDSETPDDIAIPSVVNDDINNLVCGYHLAILRPKRDKVIGQFLNTALYNSLCRKHFGRMASGATRYGLSLGAIHSCPVLVPSILEQKVITKIFFTIDQVIDQTKQLIAKYERIKTGLMQDLLARGIDGDGDIRSEESHEFMDSPLGRIPADWEVIELRSITEKIADRDHFTPKYCEEGILMISPTHFFNTEDIDFDSAPKISLRAHLKNREKTDLKEGDIILHRIGAGLGKVRIYKSHYPEISILHSLALVRGNEKIYPLFLKWAFRDINVLNQMGIGTQSIGVPDLGLDKIGSLLFKIPKNKNEQILISERIESVQVSINSYLIELAKMRKLKSGLMQDLLTGKVRVDALMKQPVETV